MYCELIPISDQQQQQQRQKQQQNQQRNQQIYLLNKNGKMCAK